jgi:ferredoxin
MGESSAGWPQPPATLEAHDLDRLITALRTLGYTVIGPRVRDGALVYDELQSAAALPAGWVDEQAPGHYRLRPSGDGRLFGVTHGASAWKRWLHPPVAHLWRAERVDGVLRFVDAEPPPPPMAFLGVRACELAAIGVQDRVLLDPPDADLVYRGRREPVFLVAVQCARASGTCFCASMGTGPRSRAGFDLALTEVVSDGRHFFRVEIGTHRGADVLQLVPHHAATPQEIDEAERTLADVPRQMGRWLDTDGLPAKLAASYERPHWQTLEARCLACGNCTLVCPTCFCVTVDERTALAGEASDRVRRWDTCFSADFSYIHGGSVRQSTQARYRQWLTHKLSTWHAQFGTSGCVGCGRCITWCPVGIDITEEAPAAAEAPFSGRARRPRPSTTHPVADAEPARSAAAPRLE